MRHRKNTIKLNRTSSHRRCMFANMLKSLVYNGKIETTLAKAKFLQPMAEKLVTLARKNSLDARRRATAELMIRRNPLTPKERREVKSGDYSSWNVDRHVINKLFADIAPQYENTNGGYTRIIKAGNRVGDNAPLAVLEFI